MDYDHNEISLYEIFEEYGTAARPKENPNYDPKPPPPKEKKPPVIKQPSQPDGEGVEGDGEANQPEEPEEEEVFIPPCERVLYYDFDTFNGKDPILLALMIK